MSPNRRFEHRLQRLALRDSSDVGRGSVVGECRTDLVVRRERNQKEPPLGIDTLELRHAVIDEFLACGAEHPVDRLRREDPARWSETLDPLGDDHRLAVQVAVLVDHLSGVESDPHLDRRVETVAVEVAHLHLHLAGGRDCSTRRCERRHQAVTHLLDESSAVRLDGLACHLLDLSTDLSGGVVADGLIQTGRLDQIGEQHGDRALRDRHHGRLQPDSVATVG